MHNYIGLIIAVENYNETSINPVKFAKNDATELRDAFIKLGCDENKIELVVDARATKTTIEEKIRELSQYATESDTILLYFAGHGLFHNGRNLITCADTSLRAIENTTIDINFILASLDKSKSSKVIAFLDCCHSGIEFSELERSPVNDFDTGMLKYEYSNAEHLTVFASCKSNEKSQADIERKHGVWSYFLLEALKGNTNSLYDSGILFSDKLQKYLADNTRQRVKDITPEKKNQTPVKFGKETTERFIVADISKILKSNTIAKDASVIKFEKATIASLEEGSIRSLPGFKSHYKVPKAVNNHNNSWVHQIANQLILDNIHEIEQLIKDGLKYKRKDIQETEVEDGQGQLSTSDFDYVITIKQSSTNAANYKISRSIENFKNSDVLNSDIFNEIFEGMFDELKFYLNTKFNIVNIIDRIEEIDDDEIISVTYDSSDLTKCVIKLAEFKGAILLSEYEFIVKSNSKKSPKDLIEGCQNVLQLLGHQGIQNLIN